MAKSVIIRIELRGEPSRDEYEKLHGYMRKKHWRSYLKANDGSNSRLPRAMYAGDTDSELSALAEALQQHIVTSIWSKGAIVLVIEWSSWAQQSKP